MQMHSPHSTPCGGQNVALLDAVIHAAVPRDDGKGNPNGAQKTPPHEGRATRVDRRVEGHQGPCLLRQKH